MVMTQLSGSITNLMEKLSAALAEGDPGEEGDVTDLRRLSGGASQETWSFDYAGEPLILRRRPGGIDQATGSGMSLNAEADIIRAARTKGVQAPAIRYVLRPEDGLGPGFVMARVDGEALPQKVFRDPALEETLPKLAFECGAALAGIHTIEKDTVPGLPEMPAVIQIETYRATYEGFGDPHPVFELAFNWLEDNRPASVRQTVVHGDFRHGNLLIAPQGLAAVLDWELAHVGDPMEDLGWICVNSWRFGRSDMPVGGFGRLEDLFEGYESAGGQVDRDAVHYWQVFGSLKWGIMCTTMVNAFRTGMDRSVERAAIGRRSSEAEIDLLNLLIE
jgi:aminoglycoside phosphotransferase (APT) family kinase protein